MDMIYENDSETMAESVFEELRSFDGNRNDSLGQLLPMAMNLNAIEPDNMPVDFEFCESISKSSNSNQILTNQNTLMVIFKKVRIRPPQVPDFAPRIAT